MPNIYITGDEKIYITAGLASIMQSLGYYCGVYKPICTGAFEKDNFLQSKDLMTVKFFDPYIKTYFSYLLKSSAAPILSAAEEKIIIDKNVILQDYQVIKDKFEFLFVDGLSGLTTPLSKNFLEEDIIRMLDLPMLLVVSGDNINNTIMSLNRAKEKGINTRGVIVYDCNEDDINIKLMPKLIKEYTDTKVLGMIPNPEKNPADLITEILNRVNIEEVFQIPIVKLK